MSAPAATEANEPTASESTEAVPLPVAADLEFSTKLSCQALPKETYYRSELDASNASGDLAIFAIKVLLLLVLFRAVLLNLQPIYLILIFSDVTDAFCSHTCL